MQTTNALLDTNTLEVVCQDCGDNIANVAESMKRTLKSFGQIIRDNSRKAFMMACRNCNANREIVLDHDDNTVCSICHNAVNVHLAMKQAIMEIGHRINAQPKDAPEPAKKSTRKKSTRKKSTRKTV